MTAVAKKLAIHEDHDTTVVAEGTAPKKKVFGLEIDAVRPSSSGDLLIAPEDIQLGHNGRWQSHPPEKVEEMYRSFVDEKQLQAITVRRVGTKVQLVMGYRRLLGGLLYNERHPDDPMRMKCTVVTCNEEEALRRNVAENRVRSETSPVDDAHNQRRFREDYGWTEKKIAEFYGQSTTHVAKLAKIPALAFDVQMKVHNRELSIDNAVALAALPEDEQRKMLETAPPVPAVEGASTGPTATTNSTVTKKVRAKKIADGGKLARSLSEVREFVESLSGPGESQALKDFSQNMLWFIQGKLSDDKMEDYLRGAFPRTEAEEEA
jgi:ParB/RepB/Spo0J family partition protein